MSTVDIHHVSYVHDNTVGGWRSTRSLWLRLIPWYVVHFSTCQFRCSSHLAVTAIDTIEISRCRNLLFFTPVLLHLPSKMLEGTAKIGHGYGTFDRNLDMEAVRNQEEGGTRTLPS